MTGTEIVRAAIPDASDELAEHILWARTPFPVGRVSVRDLYLAASRYRRACANGRDLCDFCDRLVPAGERFLCDSCSAALGHSRDTR
jgi:hypothetical protein